MAYVKLKFDFSPYLEKLAQAGQDIDTAAERAALAAGKVLQAGMKRRVAVLTGELQDHIEIEQTVDGNRHRVEVGIIRGKNVSKELARKANAQEYGTSSMAAHPYARPTAIEDRGKALQAAKKSFKEDGVL